MVDNAEVAVWGEGIENTVNNGSYWMATASALQAITPADGEYPGGNVVSDSDPENNGQWIWDGSTWVFKRGFPDSLATLESVGGTANAITASAATGVNPSSVVALLIVPTADNTGATTINIDDTGFVDILSPTGTALAGGEFVAGVPMMLIADGDDWRIAFPANVVSQVQGYADAAAESEAKAEQWAEEDEDVEVEAGLYSAKHWAAKAEDSATELETLYDTAVFNSTPSGNIWLDIDGNDPNVVTLADRVKGGKAFSGNNNRETGFVAPDWDTTLWAEWLYRDSEFCWITQKGLTAISGISKASDAAGLASPATIGVAGHVLGDNPNSPAWALYADGILSDPSGWVVGLEVAVKNTSGSDFVSRPWTIGQSFGTTAAIWLAGGGDDSYGGAATHPTDMAIGIIQGAHTFNSGIIFEHNALTVDGNGIGTAMAMGKGHQLRWDTPDDANSNGPGAAIFSSVDTVGGFMSMTFDDNAVNFGSSGTSPVSRLSHTAGATAYVQLEDGTTSPAISAQGDSSDIDLILSPKGSGVIQMTESFSGTGNAATHRMFIKDSAGNTWTIALSPN